MIVSEKSGLPIFHAVADQLIHAGAMFPGSADTTEPEKASWDFSFKDNSFTLYQNADRVCIFPRNNNENNADEVKKVMAAVLQGF